MAGQLNLSLVLRADASGFKGEVRGAAGELKELGGVARQAGGSIGAQISSGVSRATGALRGFGQNIAGGLRGSIGNIANQLQDVFVQLQAGVNPLIVVSQQLPQALIGFGPQGAVVGAVIAGAGLMAKAFFDFGEDAESAADQAERSFKDALDSIRSSVDDGLPSAQKLLAQFQELPEALRGAGIRKFEDDLREAAATVADQEANVAGVVDQLRELIKVREELGPSAERTGRAGSFAIPRAEVEALTAVLRDLDAGAIDTKEALAQVRDVAADGSEKVSQVAAQFSASVTELDRAKVALGAVQEAARAAATGVEAELCGRLVPQLEGVQDEVGKTTDSFRQMYEDVVGGSYVPDMVTETEGWFQRLGRSMTTTTTDSAEIVGDAFRGLTRNVGQELAQLVTTTKFELNDLLSFVDSITTQILGRLIEGGLNAGINALFAPSSSATLQPAFTTPGGTPVHTLHQGGVVGQAGVPRLADPAVFAAALPRRRHDRPAPGRGPDHRAERRDGGAPRRPGRPSGQRHRGQSGERRRGWGQGKAQARRRPRDHHRDPRRGQQAARARRPRPRHARPLRLRAPDGEALMAGEVSRAYLRPQDRLELNFTESMATHCVALYIATGELRIEPIERANQIALDWRQRPAPPGAAVTFNIYLLSAGRTLEALEDPQVIARLESCEPLLFAVESEEDAELIAAALHGHLARLNVAHGRH